jgi:hypothetical protein
VSWCSRARTELFEALLKTGVELVASLPGLHQYNCSLGMYVVAMYLANGYVWRSRLELQKASIDFTTLNHFSSDTNCFFYRRSKFNFVFLFLFMYMATYTGATGNALIITAQENIQVHGFGTPPACGDRVSTPNTQTLCSAVVTNSDRYLAIYLIFERYLILDA